MKLRTITGAVYVAVLVAFYVLKVLVSDLFFDGLIYAMSFIGAFEITRAFQDKLTKAERICVFAFAGICTPAVALGKTFGFGLQAGAVCLGLFVLATLSLLVLKQEETTLESLGVTLLSGIYPTFLLAVLVFVNHIELSPVMAEVGFSSDVAILLIFVISAVSDTFAYLFGKFLRGKFPKKMAESISPNKTVIGGIGGIVGGVVGAVVVYFIYNAVVGSYSNMAFWLFVYIVIGVLGSVANEFGDLVESSIKRKVGIKDMGKLMPGHGGILDRIDGTLFTASAVYLIFMLVKIFTM